jgi:hypothetical protein
MTMLKTFSKLADRWAPLEYSIAILLPSAAMHIKNLRKYAPIIVDHMLYNRYSEANKAYYQMICDMSKIQDTSITLMPRKISAEDKEQFGEGASMYHIVEQIVAYEIELYEVIRKILTKPDAQIESPVGSIAAYDREMKQYMDGVEQLWKQSAPYKHAKLQKEGPEQGKEKEHALKMAHLFNQMTVPQTKFLR